MKRDLLRQTSITTVAGKIVSKGNSARDSSVDHSASAVLPTPEEVRLFIEERNFEAFLRAYRLTGMSIVKYEQGTMLIELSTSYEG